MKLLRKSEITSLKERDRVREIAEGQKIARKVDELRELQSTTEKKLNDFRDSSLRTIGEEIKTLGAQRDTLAAEVSSLQKKLDSMLPNLGTTREELDKKEDELKNLEQFLAKQKEHLDIQELDIIEVKKELSDTLAKEKTTKQATWVALVKAEEAKADALNEFVKAKNAFEKVEQEKSLAEADIAFRQEQLSAKEEELNEKESILNKERKELEREKVKLADRQKMVERTLERLREQRIHAE